MIVLIPAYEPDEKLIRLLEVIVDRRVDINVVLVNDGSGSEYDAIFDRAATLGFTVIGHPVNRGKGYALKQGLTHVGRFFPGHDVVCADCDGQHSVIDILRMARNVAADPDAMVLGSRKFTGRVPIASRFGNAVTRVAFARSTGRRLYDTQTGLRGYPSSMLAWLQTVHGDRFEYELNVLLQATEAGVTIHEIPVETTYIEGNASSHFRPLVDSARVYAPLVKFSLSSLVALAIDTVLLLVATELTGNLLASVVAARLVSSTFNFVANRRLVFSNRYRRSSTACATRYYTLATAIMAANYAVMHVLYERLGLALLPSKLLTEATLFMASYQVQKRFIFAGADVATRPSTEPMPAMSARSLRTTSAGLIRDLRAAASVSAVQAQGPEPGSAVGRVSSDEGSMHESSRSFDGDVFRKRPFSRPQGHSMRKAPRPGHPTALRGR